MTCMMLPGYYSDDVVALPDARVTTIDRPVISNPGLEGVGGLRWQNLTSTTICSSMLTYFSQDVCIVTTGRNGTVTGCNLLHNCLDV